MKKPLTLPRLKKKVWEQFSLFIRLRDAAAWAAEHPEYNGEPIAPCITCKRMYPALGRGCLQAGHFIPGRNNAVLFNEDQVNAQCDSCNRHKKGNWPAYYEVMIQRHGRDKVDEMITGRNKITKFDHSDLEQLLALYTKKVQKLQS